MQLKWTELAGLDLENVEAYITKENSPHVAIDVVLKILNTVEMVLPKHPQAGRTGRKKGTLELVIDGVPFIVVYRLQLAQNCIEILRVLHDSQELYYRV